MNKFPPQENRKRRANQAKGKQKKSNNNNGNSCKCACRAPVDVYEIEESDRRSIHIQEKSTVLDQSGI